MEDACRNKKPNYISVMNYNYQVGASGIPIAPMPGSAELMTCSSDSDCGRGAFCQPMSDVGFRYCVRVDFSDRELPALNELSIAPGIGGLDETIGVSGAPDDRDIVLYWSGGAVLAGPSFGPIDWNGDGVATGTHVSADIDDNAFLTLIRGFDDWSFIHATLDTPGYSKAARDPNPALATCSP